MRQPTRQRAQAENVIEVGLAHLEVGHVRLAAFAEKEVRELVGLGESEIEVACEDDAVDVHDDVLEEHVGLLAFLVPRPTHTLRDVRNPLVDVGQERASRAALKLGNVDQVPG